MSDFEPEAAAGDAIDDLAAALDAERASWKGADGAHPSLELVAPSMGDVEQLWRTYWMPLLRGEDGSFSLEKLKGELWDAHFLVDQARKVYHHVTGNITDNLTASAEGIIALADHRVAVLTETLRLALEHERDRADAAVAELTRLRQERNP